MGNTALEQFLAWSISIGGNWWVMFRIWAPHSSQRVSDWLGSHALFDRVGLTI